MTHSIAPPAPDVDATVLIAGLSEWATVEIPARTVAAARAVIDRPGYDLAPARHRHRQRQPRRAPRWLRRLGTVLWHSAPLLVGVVVTVCAVVFLGTVTP